MLCLTWFEVKIKFYLKIIELTSKYHDNHYIIQSVSVKQIVLGIFQKIVAWDT